MLGKKDNRKCNKLHLLEGAGVRGSQWHCSTWSAFCPPKDPANSNIRAHTRPHNQPHTRRQGPGPWRLVFLSTTRWQHKAHSAWSEASPGCLWRAEGQSLASLVYCENYVNALELALPFHFHPQLALHLVSPQHSQDSHSESFPERLGCPSFHSHTLLDVYIGFCEGSEFLVWPLGGLRIMAGFLVLVTVPRQPWVSSCSVLAHIVLVFAAPFSLPPWRPSWKLTCRRLLAPLWMLAHSSLQPLGGTFFFGKCSLGFKVLGDLVARCFINNLQRLPVTPAREDRKKV